MRKQILILFFSVVLVSTITLMNIRDHQIFSEAFEGSPITGAQIVGSSDCTAECIELGFGSGTCRSGGGGGGGGGLPRLVGWTFKGMNWQVSPNSWEIPSVFEKMGRDGYGANAIRRHFKANWWLDSNKDQYVQRFHNVANLAADNGMWVIYDLYIWEGYGPVDTQLGSFFIWQVPKENFVSLWRTVAAELKDHGNVLLELGNEPNDDRNNPDPSHRDKWLDLCKAAIPAIREAGFTGYIVIPLPEVATRGHEMLERYDELNAVDPLKRLMIDFHLYYYWQKPGMTESSIRTWLSNNRISQLRDRGYRVLNGEFGVFEDMKPDDLAAFNNQLKILINDGYDMTAEHYGTFQFPQVRGSSMSDLVNNPPLTKAGDIYVANFSKMNIQYYGGGSYGSCQSDEQSIGQNGCSSGQACCCSSGTGATRTLHGKLKKNDRVHTAVQGSVTAYREGTNTQISDISTGSDGRYRLELTPTTYDFQYDIQDLDFPGLWVRFLSVDLTNDIYDLLTTVTTYPDEDRIALEVDRDHGQEFKMGSSRRPGSITLNGGDVTESDTPSVNENEWYYDDSTGEIIINPDMNQATTCSDGTGYGLCSQGNEPKYCDNGALVDRCNDCGCPSGQECQFDETCRTPEPTARCGDGNRDSGEQCDDGNTVSGDGCSSNCLTESSCTGADPNYACVDGPICRQAGGTCRSGVWDCGIACCCDIPEPPPYCYDGTPDGECSQDNPSRFCQGDTLVNRCSVCPCPSGQSCQPDETCAPDVTPCPSQPTFPQDRWDRVWCNQDFTEKLADTPDETSEEFDNMWGSGTVGVRADNVGFRSGRQIFFDNTGLYNFTVGSDDGVRVWINGILRLDKWVGRRYTVDSFQVDIVGGLNQIRIDYFENVEAARVSFSYEYTPAPPPDVNCAQDMNGTCVDGPICRQAGGSCSGTYDCVNTCCCVFS